MIGRQKRDQGQPFYEYKLDDVIPKDRPAVADERVCDRCADLHQHPRPFLPRDRLWRALSASAYRRAQLRITAVFDRLRVTSADAGAHPNFAAEPQTTPRTAKSHGRRHLLRTRIQEE